MITGETKPKVPQGAVFTFAADHGVTVEGVSAYPSAVTPQMVLNFLRGGAGVNVLARHVGIEVRVVDIGVAFDFEAAPGLIHRKVMSGNEESIGGTSDESRAGGASHPGGDRACRPRLLSRALA